MIFGRQSFAAPSSKYVGSPVDEVRSLNETSAKNYELARTEADALDVLYENLDVEERNAGIKKAAIGGLRTDFAQMVADGDYRNHKYTVRAAQKKFLTDKKLQGAIKSKEQKNAYQKTLQEKLEKGLAGEKGGLSEKQYKYAMTVSNLSNQGELQYDPETMSYDGMFQGYTVSDDLSQEISEELDKKAKDFKATGVIKAGGNTYTIDNIGGVERLLRNATEEVDYNEVAEALKQDLRNNEAFKRYLDESRQIDKFNKTYDPNTKTQRSIDRFKDLGSLTDIELKEIFTGVNEKQIKALENSKDIVAKTMLEEIRQLEKSFDLNNPKVVDFVYDKLAEKEQFNNVVYPAAERASFVKFEDKIFTDHAALEAIKQRNRLAVEDYKKKILDTPIYTPMTEGTSKDKFTGKDFEKKKQHIQELKNAVEQAKVKLDNTAENSSLKRTRSDEYEQALREYNVANADIQSFYDDLAPQVTEKIAKRFGMLFGGHIITPHTQFSGGMDIMPTISPEGLQSLIDQAELKKDNKTKLDLYIVQEAMSKGHTVAESVSNRLSQSLASDPDYLKITSNIYTEEFSVGDSKARINLNTPDELIAEYYNSNALSSNLKIHSIPVTGDRKYDPTLTTDFYATATNILSNPQDLTYNNVPLDDILAGNKGYKFWTKGTNDKEYKQTTEIDLSKSAISLATGASDGAKRMSVAFYNKAGNPIIISEEAPNDSEGSRSAVVLESKDPKTFDPLYKTMMAYAVRSGDIEKAMAIKGDMDYGYMFNAVRLGNTVDPFEIKSPEGNTRMVAFQGEVDKNGNKTDASTIIDMTPYIEDQMGNKKPNPNYKKPFFEPLGLNSTFRSNEELVKTLAKHF